MITAMNRDSEKASWKYVDHDQTKTVGGWIEELLDRTNESESLTVDIFSENVKLATILCEKGYLSRYIAVENMNIKKNCTYFYNELENKKVRCAEWRFAPRFLNYFQSDNLNSCPWWINLYLEET